MSGHGVDDCHGQLVQIAIGNRDESLCRCCNLFAPCAANTCQQYLLACLQMTDTFTNLHHRTDAFGTRGRRKRCHGAVQTGNLKQVGRVNGGRQNLHANFTRPPAHARVLP